MGNEFVNSFGLDLEDVVNATLAVGMVVDYEADGIKSIGIILKTYTEKRVIEGVICVSHLAEIRDFFNGVLHTIKILNQLGPCEYMLKKKPIRFDGQKKI